MHPSFPGGFTVLMAIYGGDDPYKFEEAVNSVFRNTLKPDKFMLVVDGPLTDTLECSVGRVVDVNGDCVDVVRIKQNVGLAGALNFGIERIVTSWIVRADSDDINLPNRFFEIAKALQEDPELALVGSAILEFDEHNYPMLIRHVPLSYDEIKQYAVRRNPFNHMSVAFKKDVVMGVGGYPNLHLREDYGLWCLLIQKKIKMANLNSILVHVSAGAGMYRRRGGVRYALEEFKLQKFLIECDMKSISEGFIDGSARAAIFMMPASLRGWFYRKKLRSTFVGSSGSKDSL